MNDSISKASVEVYYKDIIRWYINEGYKFDEDIEEKKNDQIFINFYEKARGDLDASKVLYENELFSQSIFLIQQSVEKLGKSIFLLGRMCSLKELKVDVGHKLSLFFLSRYKEILISLRKYISGKIFIENIESTLDSLNYLSRSRIKNLNKSLCLEYREFRDYLESYEKVSKDIPEQIEFAENYEIQMDNVTKMFEMIIQEKETYTKEKMDLDEKRKLKKVFMKEFKDLDLKKEILISIVILNILFYMVVISMNLEKHVTSTRYPERRKYTKKTQLVKIYPLISKTVENLIFDYKTILMKLGEII